MLAEATFNQDKYEDAREYYKEAIKLNPQRRDDQYQLANIYLAENDSRWRPTPTSKRFGWGWRAASCITQFGFGLLQFARTILAV